VICWAVWAQIDEDETDDANEMPAIEWNVNSLPTSLISIQQQLARLKANEVSVKQELKNLLKSQRKSTEELTDLKMWKKKVTDRFRRIVANNDYRAGNAEHGWTKTFNFTTKPEVEESWSPRIAIYGDLGLINGVSIPFINKQVAEGAYDAIFHVGDISYNLDSLNGQIGDEFFRQMETAMASLPYQMTVGNHESASNFSQYVSRFTMIDQKSGSVNNHFYSFNIGPVHVVAFSSEFYYFTQYGSMQIHNQFEWLEADLKEANKPENKAKRPWLIVAGHRPMYCSSVDHDDCTDNESILRKGIPIVQKYGLEDLFYRYGVDIIIGAHEHTYERLFPVYDRQVFNGSAEEPYRNPKAPIHLLVGSAGCQEEVDPFVSKPEHWSAKRISDYGITEFHVLNKTHIRNGQVVDAVTLIKEKHGPEAWL
ncbi:PREDICTED: acid phosphatase type 7-like, partial [Rhagoletis zephyria]|uniref:acid phosphatase type 7-like n=1 Tax=Rhagoletis zephyria TaxID=28612 RepID=UPI0008116909